MFYSCLHLSCVYIFFPSVTHQNFFSSLNNRVIFKLLASKSEGIRVQALKVLGYFLKYLSPKWVNSLLFGIKTNNTVNHISNNNRLTLFLKCNSCTWFSQIVYLTKCFSSGWSSYKYLAEISSQHTIKWVEVRFFFFLKWTV